MDTIDELAHLSALPSRTIRFYNTQGLLPPPVMQGRVAYYDDEHLVVLNIIKQLGAKAECIDELTRQGLLSPVQIDNEEMYSGDDVLLIELYERLEYLG